MGEITITKLPECLDANKIADKAMINAIYDNYSTCPVCGTNDEVFMNSSPYWSILSEGEKYIDETPKTARYGYQKGVPFWKRIGVPKQYWCISHFHCKQCGCEWDSPEYPLFNVPKGYKDFMWQGRLLRSNEFLA